MSTSTSKIYVYFKENGSLVSKSPYVENGAVRQGSDFELYFLFDRNTTSAKNIFSLYFKVPSSTEYNLFPFLSVDESYARAQSANVAKQFDVIKLEQGFTPTKDISKLGIYKGVTYDCWKFETVNIHKDDPILTNLDGNLETQVVLFENNENNTITQTNYQGTFNIFVEKTLHYDRPFDVKQGDLDRFINNVKSVSEDLAKKEVSEWLPENYVINVTPNKNTTGRTESLTLKKRKNIYNKSNVITSQEDEYENVEMPLPVVNASVKSSIDIAVEEQTVSLTGSGKEEDPLNFEFSLHKAKDGYGIHAFKIGEDGNLYVQAERSDDLEEDNYKINENGELVIEL